MVVRGRGRLVLRWEQAQSNPHRERVAGEEAFRRRLTERVRLGQITHEQAGERYERFLRRHT
jgi:hypothetical protein